MPWALVWLGGDASAYSRVSYVLRRDGEEREERSFLSAAALNRLWRGGFEKRVVLVPETLFEEDACGNYRLLLEAKSGYKGMRLLRPSPKAGDSEDITEQDEATVGLLESGFECIVVPHPGIASPLRLEPRGKGIVVRREGSRLYPASGEEGESRGFAAMLNHAYNVVSQLAAKDYNVVVDLTHGTNLLVSAALTAAILASAVYQARGVEVRAYMAPVMTRPGPSAKVEFIDVTEAVGLANSLVSGVNAWRMLDERLLPAEAVEDAGGLLGPRYQGRYGVVKTLVGESRELLWLLRSGQIPLVPKAVKALSGLTAKARRGLEEMRGDPKALSAATAWLPVADAVTVSAEELVAKLARSRDAETMVEALRLLADKDMPERALGTARELTVALLLARCRGPGSYDVAGPEWSRLEELLRALARGEAGPREAAEACSVLPHDELRRISGDYERARQYRNKLMHGRISKEEKVVVEVLDGPDIRVYKKAAKLTAIEIEDLKRALEALVSELGRLLDSGGEGDQQTPKAPPTSREG